MARTIRTVAKWSEFASTDKGQAGDMKRPRPRTRSEISSSIHARELVWLDEILRGYSIRKSPGVRDWAVGESSTVCPEPANEETNPVYVNPVSAMICTDGMARSLQVREEWSGTIPIARRDWFRFFQSERLLPDRHARITGRSGPAPTSAAWCVPSLGSTTIRP